LGVYEIRDYCFDGGDEPKGVTFAAGVESQLVEGVCDVCRGLGQWKAVL
jgi:hypothetical protein